MGQQIYGETGRSVMIRRLTWRGKLLCLGLLCSILSGLSPAPAGAQTERLPRIDNNYEDWQHIRPLATFSINFSPVYFQQEKAGQTQTLDIEEALYWKRAGTLLKSLKAQKSEDTLFLFIESHSNFAEHFSVFLYLFKERRKKEVNTCTLELVPVTAKKGEGLLLLWKKGEKQPRPCGRLAGNDFQLELSLPLKELPQELQKAFPRLSFDVTTCYQNRDSGIYEDYFFTTLFVRDIR